MSIYKISPLFKKSVTDTETYIKEIDGEEVRIERQIGWRWGMVEAELDSTELESIDVDNRDGFHPYDSLEILDSSFDDGCWEEWQFPDDMPEEERERIETIYNEEGNWGLE